MKELGQIYLSWRKGTGARRHIVGRLKRNVTDGVRFEYLPEGVAEAKKEGFSSYTEFPDLTKSYNGSALDIFGQRIMKSERADINDFLSFWEISPKYKSDKYYLLARTQGLNPADNFEFLAEYNPIKGLCFLTDLAGLSTLKLAPSLLKVGDKLTYQLEKTNQFDKHAVRVLFKGQLIGYIKKIHSRVFHRVKEGELQLTIKALETNGTIKRVFVKVELPNFY
jgi:hypothetical protein